MPIPTTRFKVAAVQAAPVFLDREATIDKAYELIVEAGRNGARLVAFPESFIPAYPDWVWAVPAGEEAILNELYAQLLANAVEIPGPGDAASVPGRQTRRDARGRRRNRAQRRGQRRQPVQYTAVHRRTGEHPWQTS